MKKLASSNVVISPTVKSSSTSLSMQKKPETEQVQQKLEQYLLSRYHFRFNLLTEQTECCTFGMTAEEAAMSIIRVADSNMFNALKLISVRRGYDPRDFAMVAFGGGGPMHCAYLARELNVRNV